MAKEIKAEAAQVAENPYADIEKKIEAMLLAAEEKASKIIASARATQGESGHIPYEKRSDVAAEIARGEENVPLRLFRDNERYKDDVYVSIGGKNVLIKRGEPVMVKRKFRNIIDQSKRQNAHALDYIEGLAGKNVQYQG